MPAITLREVIAELAAGARIVADDNSYELQYPGTPIPGHMLTHELVRGGWVQGNPNGGSYRLSDAGRLAYMRSTDELGDGALLAPNACVPAAGEAQQYRCVKCGYKGPQQINHQRPNGTGECGYIAHVADGVAPPAATFTEDELVRFYEEWEFNEEDPGESEFIALVREVERRVLARTVGVALPSQAALDSPRIYMPPGLTDAEKRAFMMGVAAASEEAARALTGAAPGVPPTEGAKHG